MCKHKCDPTCIESAISYNTKPWRDNKSVAEFLSLCTAFSSYSFERYFGRLSVRVEFNVIHVISYRLYNLEGAYRRAEIVLFTSIIHSSFHTVEIAMNECTNTNSKSATCVSVHDGEILLRGEFARIRAIALKTCYFSHETNNQ